MNRPSPHFTWQEFGCHDGKPCPGHAHAAVSDLCHRFLEPLRSEFGPCTVLSGYRTPTYNRSVGGAPDSFHLYREGRAGVAADVEFRRGTPLGWSRAAEELGVNGLGRYPWGIHVDTRRGRARW